jgi:hypothetical protein
MGDRKLVKITTEKSPLKTYRVITDDDNILTGTQ